MQRSKDERIIEMMIRLTEITNSQYNSVKRECLLQRPHLAELFTAADQIRTLKKTA